MITEKRIMERVMMDGYRGLLETMQQINYNNKQPNANRDNYPFIPRSTEYAVSQLLELRKIINEESKQTRFPMTFVDCGCGIGNILRMVQKIFCDRIINTRGIELDESLIRMAKIFACPSEFINDDIRTQDYSKYDIIYFYNPIYNREKEAEFERRVIETAKPGAYILANTVSNPLSPFENLYWRGKPISNIKIVCKEKHIFQKI